MQARDITALTKKAVALVSGFSLQVSEFDIHEVHVGLLGELMEHVRCSFLNKKNELVYLNFRHRASCL